jgi:hypothetical protein
MKARKPRKNVAALIEHECITYTDRSSVHVSERGVGATFLNARRKLVRQVRYDGCYKSAQGGRRADYIIGMQAVGDVILELKGSDLDHAVSQVEATLAEWRADPIRFEPIACLVVLGSRVPRITTRSAVFEREFFQGNRTLLWIRESGIEKYNFRKLLGKTNVR